VTFVIFIVTIALALISGRVTAVAARGGVHVVNTPSEIGIGFLGMIDGYVALVSGFFIFDWYIPIAVFVGLSIFAGLVVSGKRLLVLMQSVAFVDALVIAGTVYLVIQAASDDALNL
jgi:hypothetical protein